MTLQAKFVEAYTSAKELKAAEAGDPYVDYLNMLIGFVERTWPATVPYIEFVLRFVPVEKIVAAVQAAVATWFAGGSFTDALIAALKELLKQVDHEEIPDTLPLLAA